MEEDIRIIKLYRQALLGSGKEHKTEDNKDNIRYLYVTDYFTQLTVEKKKISDSFSEIVSLDRDETENGETVAAQSYVLYYSASMMETYEKTERGMAGRCDPFDGVDTGEYPFLSIIQVHITPEILHRMEKAEAVLAEEDIVLKPFLDDLYETIGEYRKRNEEFVFRIYHVLSAGDFAVVIRSRNPRSCFEVSSRLRKRVAGCGSCGKERLAMYKTYTLLAMERDISEETVGKIVEKTGRDKVIVRVCYSCSYWSDWGEAGEEPQVALTDQAFSGLNGRYDCITELTIAEFFMLYPLILQCRTGGKADGQQYRKIEAEGTDRVKKIAALLKQGKLSYLNERYVVADLERIYQGMAGEENLTDKISLKHQENMMMLEDCTEKRIENLKNKLEATREKLKEFSRLHRNVLQYFNLLENLLASCGIINGQSDTRIYARGLLEQLEIVEDSLAAYIKIYQRTGEFSEFAEMMMDYLREAVHVLDCYAEYIRNNNMQSLQTPNYNIESKMGMEKILIGYSEYLRQYIQNYQKGFRMAGVTGDYEKEFCPVMIPDLSRTDIGVEVLFPEWRIEHNIPEAEGEPPLFKETGLEHNITETEEEKKNRRKTLLVVTCSALKELSDMPMLMAILGHEVAHQFRYEERECRNQVVLSMLVWDYAEAAAKQMVQAARMEEDALLMVKEQLQQIFRMALAGAIEAWMLEKEDTDWMNMPLDMFEREYYTMLDSFIGAWNYRSEFVRKIKIFMKDLEMGYCHDEKVLVDNLKKINENMNWERGKGKEAKEEIERSLKEIISSYKNRMEGDEYGDIIGKEIDEEYEKLCFYLENIFYELSDKMPKRLEEKFFSEVYEKAAEAWEEIGNRYRKKNMLFKFRAWTMAGRYYGLDLKGKAGRKEGESRLKKAFLSVWLSKEDWGMPDVLISRYREITSDISMCCILKLSLFGYVNLCTLVMWREILEGQFNISRMATVIYVMGTVSEEDVSYGELCNRIFQDLISYAEENWMGSERGRENFIQSTVSQMPIKNDGNYLVYEDAEEILKQEKEMAEGKQEQDFFRHLELLLQFFEKITMKGYGYVQELRESTALLEDYRRGAKTLQKVRKAIEGERDQNVSIKKWLDMSDSISHYLENTHYQVGSVREEEINSKSMNYLLWLYYCRRMNNARNKVWEGGETDAD